MCESVYQQHLRDKIGDAAPESLAELLSSRGVGAELDEFFAIALEAALMLPSVRHIDPEKALTETEVRVLHDGGFDTTDDVGTDDALARGAVQYALLVKTALSVEEAARRLDVKASRIRQRLGERTLYGIKQGRSWCLPRFQFGAQGLVPGIEAVLHALPSDAHPVAVLRWFTTLNCDLPADDSESRLMTPLDWLASGRSPDKAAELAGDI